MIPVAHVFFNCNLELNALLNAWNVSARMGELSHVQVMHYDGEQWNRIPLSSSSAISPNKAMYLGYTRAQLEYMAGHFLSMGKNTRTPIANAAVNSVLFILNAIQYWQETVGEPPVPEMCDLLGFKPNYEMVLTYIYVTLQEDNNNGNSRR